MASLASYRTTPFYGDDSVPHYSLVDVINHAALTQQSDADKLSLLYVLHFDKVRTLRLGCRPNDVDLMRPTDLRMQRVYY